MVAPGCRKRLPRSGSTRPAAIFSRVDFPEPLRPIKATRSPADTDSSTPDNSGVPPKVSAMSLSWISGGAIVPGSILLLLGASALNAADGLIERRQKSRAVARGERSGAAGHFAGRAQIGHQVANRQRHADRLLRERLAVRRNHLAACLYAPARQRDIGGNDDIALAGVLCNPVVGGIHAGTRRDAFDQRVARHSNEIAGDDADGQAVPDRDAVDFILDRTGVGIDVDAGEFRIRRHQWFLSGGWDRRRVVLHGAQKCEKYTLGTRSPGRLLCVPSGPKAR